MRFELLLAIKFLRATGRRALVKFTALTAIIGIASGVAATIFANSLANGFRQEMQRKILENTAHVIVSRADNAEVFDWQNLSERIAQINGVKNVSAASYDNALILGKASSAFALLRGIHSPESKIQSLKSENQKIKVQIGKELAKKIGLTIGDKAEIISGSNQVAENFQPISTEVEVTKVFSTGLYEYDSTWIRVSLADAAQLTGKNSTLATALEIETADIYDSNRIAAHLQTILGEDFKVLDWQTANRPLFAALALERRVAILIISLVVFVAVLNVATTLALVVNGRRADIAVLKTCGARAENVVLIFLWQGALLGAIGVCFGILLGVIACATSNNLNLISLPSDVYSVNRVVLEPQVSEIILTGVAAFALSLTTSIFPAWAAARVRPLESLRQ